MRVVVTGADGFIGSNLRVCLQELGYGELDSIASRTDAERMRRTLAGADFVFHLAGVNRPPQPADFAVGNVGFTRTLCEALEAAGRCTPVVFTSSTQAELDNPYGRSKREAEEVLLAHGRRTDSPVRILRLTNVFGKWCRPNYNSAVATFCYNIARGLPITINDPSAPLCLVHVDDVLAEMVRLLERPFTGTGFGEVAPVYSTTVGEVARLLNEFATSRESLVTQEVGVGFMRALYSTYVSYLPPESFGYRVPLHSDARGEFVEMLKTPASGQFSYFTAHPGVTRGGHYHHTKTEKFLVVRGTAHFGFRHVVSGETHERIVRGGSAEVVETVPGWTHDITNIGDDELVVMLWANEVFDRQRPDTIAMKVKP